VAVEAAALVLGFRGSGSGSSCPADLEGGGAGSRRIDGGGGSVGSGGEAADRAGSVSGFSTAGQ
jgi:hypothetical protein